MTAVLAATGIFLYVRLGSAIDNTIDQGLRARAADVSALVDQADAGLREATTLRGPDNGFAQIVGPSGSVVDATAGFAARRLITGKRLAQARQGRITFETSVDDSHVRLLAVPVRAQDMNLVVVVGSSLEPRAEALSDLERQLLLGGPIALLVASLAGYLLAAAALRPVERMSQRAATISAASPGRRLPIPPAEDEISRLGARLNDMLLRLESALERERALVANASHELRTPLALLKTEIELALDEPDSAPALAAALRSAGEETDRLAQLADDLLLLARFDAGELPIRRTLVPVKEVLDAIATRFQRRAADRERSITVATDHDLVALVDRRRIEQALANLVENALRHGSGTIRLEASIDGGSLTLRAQDEGPGFTDAFLPHAFDRFSRADSSRPGAGLGLAIVAAIANAHGGTATASNIPGEGTKVGLNLPLPRTAYSERDAER
jgi:signal transduction histidine kinase